jgi:hypothetical protein
MKKLLHTFFFGYASYKYRRLIRTPIILTAIVLLIGVTSHYIQEFDYQDDDLINILYKNYQSDDFDKDDWYITANNSLVASKELVEFYGNKKFVNLISEGKLKKVTGYLKINKSLDKSEFIELLRVDKSTRLLVSSIATREGLAVEHQGVNDFFIDYKLNLREGKFTEGLATILVTILGIIISFFVIGIISYLIEPFINSATSKLRK